MDEKKQTILHQKLLADLSDHIPRGGQEHESLKTLMKSYVPVGLLEGKTLLQQFDALSRKGYLKPGQYGTLETICKESGNDNLVELINKAKDAMNVVETEVNTGAETNNHQRTIQDNVGASANNQKRAIQDNVVSDSPKRPKTDDVMKYYQNTGKKGLMLILNSREDRKDCYQKPYLLTNNDLEDTDRDVGNMKAFFENQLRYIVYDPRSLEEDDLTTEQLDGQLDDIKNLMNGSLGRSYYCFICVILSHGNEKGIKTKDGYKNVEDIRKEFNNQNVPGFAGRPKVFLIQACRGYGTQGNVPTDLSDDEPVRREEVVDESDVTVRVPTDADTLLAFSTTPGFRSFRRVGTGSWFITECMRVFQDFYKREHLEEMLITVRNNVAHSEEWQKNDGGKQMPCVWSTLTRRLML